jgi:hypothetical protein
MAKPPPRTLPDPVAQREPQKAAGFARGRSAKPTHLVAKREALHDARKTSWRIHTFGSVYVPTPSLKVTGTRAPGTM